MIGLTHTTGYAILALGCLNNPLCRVKRISDISSCTAVPKAYLAKIVHDLTRHGLIEAKRGHHGGVRLARPANQITILEVIEAVEGKQWISRCLLFPEGCPKDFACPTQAFWTRERARIVAELKRVTVSQVIAAHPQPFPGLDNGEQLLTTGFRRRGRPRLRKLIN